MPRFLLLTLLVLAVPASAQVAVLPFAGYDLEAPNPLVGLGVEVGIPAGLPLTLAARASGEFVVPAEFEQRGRIFNKEVLQANLDVIGYLGAGSLRPFVGAGVAYTLIELDTADDDAVEGDQDSSARNVGANVLAGAVVGGLGSIAPFAQVRATLGDRTAVSAMAGLRVGF